MNSVADEPVVYLVRAVGTDVYKIGVTINLADRLFSLRMGSPIPLQLVHASSFVDSNLARQVERMVLEALKEWGLHDHGEWFRLTDADVARICDCLKLNADANRHLMEDAGW